MERRKCSCVDLNIDHRYDLQTAVKAGHLHCVGELISNGVDIKETEQFIQQMARIDRNDILAPKQPMTIAASKGYTAILLKLLSAGADPDIKDPGRDSPLIFASRRGHKDIVEILLEKKVEVNATNVCGESALISGSINGHETVVEKLLNKGAWVDQQDVHSKTALFHATEAGHTRCVALLIQFKANVNLLAIYGLHDKFSALWIAACEGYYEILDMLLEAKADVNHAVNNHTPLRRAINGGHTECVRLLLKAIPNVCLTLGAEELLHWALPVCNDVKDVKILKLLLGAGLDIEAKDTPFGRTPLLKAVHLLDVEGAKFLLQNGSNIEARSNKDEPALHLAIEGFIHLRYSERLRNQDSSAILIKLLKLLIENGIDKEARDHKGNTALTHSITTFWGCPFSIVKFLIEAGCNVHERYDKKPYGKYSLLALSVYDGKVDCCEALVNAGCDVNDNSNKCGLTPLMLCPQDNNQPQLDGQAAHMAKSLLLAGADVRLTDKGNHTAWDRKWSHFQKDRDSYSGTELIQVLFIAGAHLFYNPRYKKYEGSDSDMKNVKSLLNLCRWKIRTELMKPTVRRNRRGINRRVGRNNNLFVAVPHLPLPKSLKNYLLYQ